MGLARACQGPELHTWHRLLRWPGAGRCRAPTCKYCTYTQYLRAPARVRRPVDTCGSNPWTRRSNTTVLGSRPKHIWLSISPFRTFPCCVHHRQRIHLSEASMARRTIRILCRSQPGTALPAAGHPNTWDQLVVDEEGVSQFDTFPSVLVGSVVQFCITDLAVPLPIRVALSTSHCTCCVRVCNMHDRSMFSQVERMKGGFDGCSDIMVYTTCTIDTTCSIYNGL